MCPSALAVNVLFMFDNNFVIVGVLVTSLSLLQVSKFSEYVSSVGQTTLARIARAGPDSKVIL